MAAVNRNNSDILKGSYLMLFVDNEVVAFATSNTLSFTTNTTEVSTKDHGLYPSVIAQSISWEATAENLACGENIDQLLKVLDGAKNNTLVTLKFCKPTNWNDKGIVGIQGAQGWQASPNACDSGHQMVHGTQANITNIIAEGKALLTSFSINAPAGDNSTISATFTGVGEISTCQTAPTQA